MRNPGGHGKVSYRLPRDESEGSSRRPRSPNDDSSDTNDSSSSRKRRSSSEESSTRLLSACEPLFEQICLYSHAIQNGVKLSFPQVRQDIEDLFEKIRHDAHSHAVTAGLLDDRMEQSLMFFVDNFFADCGQLPIAADWGQNRLAFGLVPPNYVGDEQFFTYLEQTLKEKSEGVKQKLAVYFTCIGLGMTGIYGNNPQMLRRKQLEIAQRIRNSLESNARRRICPDAYESINDENLIEPPIKPPLLIGIALAGMLIVLLFVYFIAYRASTNDLKFYLQDINSKLEAGLPNQPAK